MNLGESGPGAFCSFLFLWLCTLCVCAVCLIAVAFLRCLCVPAALHPCLWLPCGVALFWILWPSWLSVGLKFVLFAPL